MAQLVQNPPEMWETWVQSLGWKDPLEKGMATHSSIVAWRIPWTEQSMGSQRVRHDLVTFTFTLKHKKEKKFTKPFSNQFDHLKYKGHNDIFQCCCVD